MSKQNIVVPGEELAVAEEFLPGPGAYLDEENWVIRSSLTGRVLRDLNLKFIRVASKRQKYGFPTLGSIVIGFVSSMKTDFALVTIIADSKMNPLSFPLTGILHISQATSGFIRNMYEIIGIGDLIKTKIISRENPFQLTTKTPGLGVILATCSKCGAILRRSKSGALTCPRCGNVESRLIAPDYINLRNIII